MEGDILSAVFVQVCFINIILCYLSCCLLLLSVFPSSFCGGGFLVYLDGTVMV
jgi:hypothetical protein